MFENNPAYIIIHSTNLDSLIELDKLHRQYGRYVINDKRQRIYFQGHYFINSRGDITPGRLENQPTLHPLSDNSIQVYINSEYNFLEPSQYTIDALKVKLFEIMEKYHINSYNVLTQTQYLKQVGELKYKTWLNSSIYYPNDIIYYRGILYQLIEKGVTTNNLNNLENNFMCSFTNLTKNVNNIQIEVSANVYSNCSIDNYCFIHSLISNQNPKLERLLNNKTFKILSKDGSNLITINQIYNDSIIPDSISGNILTKIKPISDWNCTYYLTNINL